MNSVQAFWHFLYTLQHATSQAMAEDGSSVRYGGNALQAFVVALHEHLQFVWIDN
jgi:hypothetical protein